MQSDERESQEPLLESTSILSAITTLILSSSQFLSEVVFALVMWFGSDNEIADDEG